MQKDEIMKDYEVVEREIPAFMKKVSHRVSFLGSSTILYRSVDLYNTASILIFH